VPIKKLLGTIFVGHGAFVAVQLFIGFSELRKSAEAFTAPNDPLLVLWGLAALNGLIAFSALVLGIYFFREKELRFIVVLPLAILASLYGGYSLMIAPVALGGYLLQRYYRSAI